MNDGKIMIVDDEPDILDLLEKTFRLEGYDDIIKACDGQSAVDICRQDQIDLIILDVMLPKMDGYEVCKQIRQFSHCWILFLSSKNDEVDKILGLAVGGDDYVTKPFSPKEVVYRVKAQLRRAEYAHATNETTCIHIGALTVDPDGGRVLKNGKEIEMTAREFEILQYFAQNQGRVISRERLYETVWGEDSFGCDNTIMVHIRHLREKIEENPAAPNYLITMKGLSRNGCRNSIRKIRKNQSDYCKNSSSLFLWIPSIYLSYHDSIWNCAWGIRYRRGESSDTNCKYISYQFGGAVLDTFTIRMILYAGVAILLPFLARRSFRKHEVMS